MFTKNIWHHATEINSRSGGLAQMAERSLSMGEVVGLMPAPSKRFNTKCIVLLLYLRFGVHQTTFRLLAHSDKTVRIR